MSQPDQLTIDAIHNPQKLRGKSRNCGCGATQISAFLPPGFYGLGSRSEHHISEVVAPWRLLIFRERHS